MTDTKADRPTAETLLALGFVDVAGWASETNSLSYSLDGAHAETNDLRLDERNALYAFVRDEEVLYIGKTARTIRQRFTGYCHPGRQQRTNWRCNGKIKAALAARQEIRIFVFNPISHLRYGLFDLNIAAGLEDALIAAFDPAWNGREKGQPVSEEVEREEAEEALGPPNRFAWSDGDVEFYDAQGNPMSHHQIRDAQTANAPSFSILLGEAYYRQGLINPGVEASRLLGQDGEPIEIAFSDGTAPVVSRIDRTANRTGAVRVVGRNSTIAHWFQAHFRKGESVEARIVDANRILLMARPDRATGSAQAVTTTDG
ncbi:GIY-YIG nuclease family protein [Enterovirga rhinocerotis]|uniref:GIY-YIG domain-containing protein n=1 Tax=Enterovirga rhinocerotis TaxID=1339210 RepID=A0A4R7BJV3_9HYPH|nr:GIY-YIG nuclease family protein [Enterovirga rhinocerotis]TDR85293.1 hypothetical protein EV668_4847 [Enterovirga rhinocerotis]